MSVYTVTFVIKTTWEIGKTWELRTATPVPRPIQCIELDLRNKTTSEFRIVFHSPLGVTNSHVTLYKYYCQLRERILSGLWNIKGTPKKMPSIPETFNIFREPNVQQSAITLVPTITHLFGYVTLVTSTQTLYDVLNSLSLWGDPRSDEVFAYLWYIYINLFVYGMYTDPFTTARIYKWLLIYTYSKGPGDWDKSPNPMMRQDL